MTYPLIDDISNSFPPSDATIKAEHLLNSGLKTIFLGLKPSTPMACAVEQVHILFTTIIINYLPMH